MNKFLKNKICMARQGFVDQSKIVIGLIGSEAGTDTTYCGLQIGTYSLDWMNKRTCYVDYFSYNQIHSMNLYYKMNLVDKEEKQFSYNGMDYYGGVTSNKLYSILGGGYQCIIIDFRNEYNRARSELLLCDKIILVTSFRPWSLYHIDQCFEKYLEVFKREVTILSYSMSKGYTNWIKDRYKETFNKYGIKKLIQIPYNENPFIISEEVLKTFNQLFHMY